MSTVMKVGVGSAFKSNRCVNCDKDACVIVFNNEEPTFFCIEHYIERNNNADSNKDV